MPSFCQCRICGLVLTRAIDGRLGSLFETEPGEGHVFLLKCVTKPSLEIASENPEISPGQKTFDMSDISKGCLRGKAFVFRLLEK